MRISIMNKVHYFNKTDSYHAFEGGNYSMLILFRSILFLIFGKTKSM